MGSSRYMGSGILQRWRPLARLKGSSILLVIFSALALFSCCSLILTVTMAQKRHKDSLPASFEDKAGRRPESPCDESNVLPMTDSCNCLRTTVLDGWAGTCCSRTLRHAHKMGNHLAREALTHQVWSNLRIATDTFRYEKPEHDYRDAIIVRDMYSTIISGYLYHKKGHECWLDSFGRPTNITTIDNRWWETIRTVMPFPVRRKRSLCRYLAEESVEHGLHLYAHMSLFFWFKHLVLQHSYSRTPDDANRTFFLCFGELSSGESQQSAVSRIINHLWPGAHNFRFQSIPLMKNYNGSHSTKDFSENYKAALRRHVAKIDEKYYSGEIAALNSLFGCDYSR